ncbi:hypothetical protein GCM10018785_25640 [Streptomyces longispororuber]|uniref:WD40 repeat domain-containing protein n=1 Tax=Streptomyces longispororuber TaxID=68230 RepID=A0A918ZKU0_9ACTN|nr:WD40 repeat domain-containing protein [Streptomyces longispororuber]GHE55113.1 hypothetical protein GCM10018785_25640 [Streptomyces longispororuber]
MNVDQLVRRTLQEQAAEHVRAPGDLADRVLRTRRHRRTARGLAGGAVAVAAVVATAVTVTVSDPRGVQATPASETRTADVEAHPDQSPPRELIAAGNAAVSGFYTGRTVKEDDGDELFLRRYHLLDQKTGGYAPADEKWAWVDVAPGLRTAAVLEGELPASRIGLLDLMTGRVTRWITVERPVAAVTWSPDGRRLVATAYSRNPDRLIDRPDDHPANGPRQHSSRTGFYVIDAATGDVGPFRALPRSEPDTWGAPLGVSRTDLVWGRDGTVLYAEKSDGTRDWYTPDGEKTRTPAGERYAGASRAGLSPDGAYAAADGDVNGSPVVDARTGKKVATVPGMQPLAWADGKRLIALGCDPKKCGGRNEFRTQLLLVTVGSGKAVPLSGFRKGAEGGAGRWVPMVTGR